VTACACLAAFRVAALPFLVFAARLRAAFTFLFVMAFLRIAILPLGMNIPFPSYLDHLH
jgi:hypothetical protein